MTREEQIDILMSLAAKVEAGEAQINTVTIDPRYSVVEIEDFSRPHRLKMGAASSVEMTIKAIVR